MSREIRHAYAASTLNRSRVEITTNHHNDTDLVSYRLNNLMTRKHAATRKFGFTLAEVLITLGIIGVVAALTMPILIKNYQKHVLMTQIKKTVTTLQNGIKLVLLSENADEICNTSYADCIYRSGHTGYSESLDIYPDFNKMAEFLKFEKAYEDWKLPFVGTIPSDSYYVLKSGAYVISAPQAAYKMIFNIDVNGSKGPNRFGYDIFEIDFSQFGSVDCNSLDPQDLKYYCSGSPIQKEDELGRACCICYFMQNGWKMNY